MRKLPMIQEVSNALTRIFDFYGPLSSEGGPFLVPGVAFRLRSKRQISTHCGPSPRNTRCRAEPRLSFRLRDCYHDERQWAASLTPSIYVGFGRYSGLWYPVTHAGDRAAVFFHTTRSIGGGFDLLGSLDLGMAQVETTRTCSAFGGPFDVGSRRCLASR